MVNTRRTPIIAFASSSLPQDPLTVDPYIHVRATIGISTNTADVVKPAISVGTMNLATIAGQVDTNILVDLNNQPLPPREDPLLEPPTEGRTHEDQPLGTTTGPRPLYYVRETVPRIGEPTIGESRVDSRKNLELARLREVVCQMDQVKPTPKWTYLP
uniref:Uncharacterized protein n=1 Tax=Cannabis sativa TaxID=3483 RepID=A0A803Q535_CANSA